jgi:hypothetical protein
MITTECMVADKPEEKDEKGPPAPHMHGGGMGGMM